MEDIRWQQRFVNLRKAYRQLSEFIEKETLNKFEKQGLIQCFEYTYELSWKTLQDLLDERGYAEARGPRPIIMQSFRDGYIEDGESWMQMLLSRNKTSHSYDEEIAQEIVSDILNTYHQLIGKLVTRLELEESS